MFRRLIILLLIVGCDNSTKTEACTGVNDIDDNCYQTVQIGEQVWLDENLKVTHYNMLKKIKMKMCNLLNELY